MAKLRKPRVPRHAKRSNHRRIRTFTWVHTQKNVFVMPMAARSLPTVGNALKIAFRVCSNISNVKEPEDGGLGRSPNRFLEFHF